MPAPSSRQPDLLGITWPMFVEQFLMMAIGTLGLWLAGQVSLGAVAVFGLANQLRQIFDRIFRVVGVGTSVVVTQHKGGGDDEGAAAMARAGLAASLWLGLISAALIGLMPAATLKLLQLPVELFELAVPFFILTAIGLALDSLFVTMLSVLRAYTFTRDSMRMTMAMNLLQVVVSIPLVTGSAGLPALGLMGLGWGHLLSRLLAVGLLAMLWLRRLNIRLTPSLFYSRHREALPPILAIGLPSAGEKIAFRIAFLMTVSMAASLGTDALAAHAWVLQAAGWVNIYMVSLSFGSEIVLGHLVGAGRLKQANATLQRALRIALVVTVSGAILSCFVTPFLLHGLNTDLAVISLIVGVLLIDLLLEPGRCLNILMLGGLRAAGDVRFPVKVSVVSNFVFGAGLAWLMGIHFGLGLPGIWIGYTVDEWVRGLCMAARWRAKGWTDSARAARRRIVQRLKPRAN
ncbi:MAG: MATE family efflux transporter [Candidatus Dactylopiibacterium carminicum]|nr:MAG: MATE family efflux transporter [Candidatus Dactylopiibacterium carminicum]